MSKSQNVLKGLTHPEADDNDPKKILRFIIGELGKSDDLARGDLYHTLDGSMTDRLLNYGIPQSYVASFLFLSQELGLMRFYGTRDTVWEVCDICYFDAFVTESHLKKCFSEIRKHNAVRKENHQMRKQLAKNGDNEANDSLEEIAAMAVDFEDLQEILAKKDQKISDLENQLKKKGGGETLAEAMKKIREKNKNKWFMYFRSKILRYCS
jgi:hypothetical protein